MSKTDTPIRPTDSRSVVDFFDPRDEEHIRAYAHVQRTGSWPADFWERIKHLQRPVLWDTAIAYKIAKVYIEDFLKEK